MTEARYFDLRCPACSWTEHCGLNAIMGWLRAARKLRPDRNPEAEILYELFLVTAPQMTCPDCGRVGLAASLAENGDDWPAAPVCRACRKPIAPERLQAVPGATLCASCQQDEESGRGRREIDYCPRCGAPLELRLSKAAGLARYVLVCTGVPPCRS